MNKKIVIAKLSSILEKYNEKPEMLDEIFATIAFGSSTNNNPDIKELNHLVHEYIEHKNLDPNTSPRELLDKINADITKHNKKYQRNL